MATQISTLAVKLTASAGAFSATMAGAGKQLASFGSSIGSVGSMVLGFGGALTALAAGGSLAYMTKQSLDAIDANAKLSDRLGISTEALTGLQHAAGLAGINNEQLTGGLEKMLKTIGGVADDGEDVANAFTKIGLNAAQLANLPTDQAFSQIAQKLTEIPNAAERAAAATTIFGKAGQSLLPLLMSGAEGIKAAQEEAAKLGVSYSRVDAAKVEQANDAITRMQSVWTGVTNQIAIGLAPYIQGAADKFTELTTVGGGIGPKVGGAIEWVAKALAVAADYTELLPAAFHGFRAGALTAIAGVLTAVDYLGSGLVKLLNLLPGVNISWTETFGNMGVPSSAKTSETWQGLQVEYYKVSFPIRISAAGHRDAPLDFGYNATTTKRKTVNNQPVDVKVKVPILDSVGTRVSKPWPLDGNGQAKPSAIDQPATLDFQPYKSVSWAAIGLR